MIRLLPAILVIVLVLYCLVDCIQTEEAAVRNLPKVAWIVIILLFPVIGSVVWLLAGRPQIAGQGRRTVPWPNGPTAGYPEHERPRPLAPDDDPEFLRQLRQSDTEHERMLKRWEEDLRKREQELRDDDGGEPTAGPEPAGR